jgi:hypothetical protein
MKSLSVLHYLYMVNERASQAAIGTTRVGSSAPPVARRFIARREAPFLRRASVGHFDTLYLLFS